MGKRISELTEKLCDFIKDQKLFFVGTATAEGRVNISPKGMESLVIDGNNRVLWLNVTGSGNETSAHLQENTRMTLMFAAFEGKPLILRLFGNAKIFHKNDPEWDELYPLFTPITGARQIIDMDIDLVQTSCGSAVPYFDFVEDRDNWKQWAAKKGEQGIKEFWSSKNQVSLDGKPTHIMSKST
ncbi:MAG: pyridoxamine 5'-phosphate oxidase family protein [Proteobacteria bacterium]|nr:pyridoxamine 5'-phosphate oxidase family protein [Pseudomonadota bacterium]